LAHGLRGGEQPFRCSFGETGKGSFAMRALNAITLLLIIVGGLNWGLVGLFDFDLVSAILGNGSAETATSSPAARIVYILVAISAIYQLVPFGRLLSSDSTAYRPNY
jgi:uncharacterized membrane protein YuzA (DUF378 family)